MNKISLIYKEAMASLQEKECEIAINKEIDSLTQHQAFDKVPIKTALSNKKVIGYRFVFKQKVTGLYK